MMLLKPRLGAAIMGAASESGGKAMRKITGGTVAACATLIFLAQSAAADLLNERCSSEWPGDFRMQSYCVDQHMRAAGEILEFYERHGLSGEENVRRMSEENHPSVQILSLCLTRWEDGFGLDYRMAAYCIDQQERGLRSMQRR